MGLHDGLGDGGCVLFCVYVHDKILFHGYCFWFLVWVSQPGGLLAHMLGSVPLLSDNAFVENHLVFRCKPKKCV